MSNDVFLMSLLLTFNVNATEGRQIKFSQSANSTLNIDFNKNFSRGINM